MKRSTYSLLLSFALIQLGLGANVALAQIKPGLWEVSGKFQGGQGPLQAINQSNAKMTPEQAKAMQNMPRMTPEMLAQMQAQMAKLPPEQRKAMEASMDAMKNMSVGNDGSMNMKVCMTKETIDAGQFTNQKGKCTNTLGSKVGNTQKYSFSCTDPVRSGEGIVVFQGNTSFTGNLKIKGIQNGKSEEITIENSGKFIDSNCGSVKPAAIVAK